MCEEREGEEGDVCGKREEEGVWREGGGRYLWTQGGGVWRERDGEIEVWIERERRSKGGCVDREVDRGCVKRECEGVW